MITANILRRTFFIKAAQYGTAFTVEVEGEEFLVTAKHLLDDSLTELTIKIFHAVKWHDVRAEVIGYLRDHVEVLYVGKSTDDALKRLRNHNKWGEITTDLGTDEVAVVYFMEIEEALFSRTSVGPVTFLSSARDEEIDRDSVALITEAALIKHFFADEKYNRQVVAQDLTEVKSVREKLLSRGYSAIQVELDLEGSFGILGTPKTGFVRRHEFVHRLRDL